MKVAQGEFGLVTPTLADGNYILRGSYIDALFTRVAPVVIYIDE